MFKIISYLKIYSLKYNIIITNSNKASNFSIILINLNFKIVLYNKEYKLIKGKEVASTLE